MAALLTGCQFVKPFEPARIIHEDAHGGGSIVSFNTAETLLASGGWAGYIRLWAIPGGEEKLRWHAHDEEISGIQFAKQDQEIVTAGYDGMVKVWSVTGTLLRKSKTVEPIRSMVVDEAENLIITGHADGFVRLWQLDTLLLKASRRTRDSDIRAVAWSAPQRLIASSAFDGSVWLWPLGKDSYELPKSSSDARTLTFSEQGTVLLGAGWFHLFRWDLSDRTLKEISTEHAGIIRNIKLVNDGRSLATISRQTDSSVLFIDPGTGAVQRRFQPHDMCGKDVSVSKNNRFMATTSDDGSVRIWWLDQPKPIEP